MNQFDEECKANAAAMASDPILKDKAVDFLAQTARYKYSYNFRWMGRPIIQVPQDLIAMQELLWSVRPDLVVETGIAHGGSLVFYASILELIGAGHVIGIDVDIRAHNRTALESHPMKKRITLIEGSSIDDELVARVRGQAAGKRTLVVLDSNHTHDHVLRELELYSSLVSVGSYMIVFDTIVEDMPENSFADRPWGHGNNPKTAVHAFLKRDSRFEIDHEIENKLLISVAPHGYLKRIR